MKLEKQKPKLFVDMDGVLAEWKPASIPLQLPQNKIQKYLNDILYEEGYFLKLHPYKNVVEAIKQIIQQNEIDVYILSCVLPNNENYPNSNPLHDKNKWLDQQFGNLLPNSHRIFVPDGEPKAEHIPFVLSNQDYLLDDYSKNLIDWINHPSYPNGIKLLNPYNDTKQSWSGPRISCTDSPDLLINKIKNIILKEKIVKKESSSLIRNIIFEIYKQDWALRNNIYTNINFMNQYYNDLQNSHSHYVSYDEWIRKNFKDYPSFPQFLHNEYLNSSFINNLLSYYNPQLYQTYLEDDLIQDIDISYE